MGEPPEKPNESGDDDDDDEEAPQSPVAVVVLPASPATVDSGRDLLGNLERMESCLKETERSLLERWGVLVNARSGLDS